MVWLEDLFCIQSFYILTAMDPEIPPKNAEK